MSARQPSRRFGCPITGCTITFSRPADRLRHVQEKHGDFKQCKVPGCNWQDAKRKGRLEEHMRKVHNTGSRCNIPLEVPESSPDQWTQQQEPAQPAVPNYGDYRDYQGTQQYQAGPVATTAYDNAQSIQPTVNYTQQSYYNPTPLQQPTYATADSTQMEGYDYAGAQDDSYAEGSEDASGQYYQQNPQYYPSS